MPRARSKSRSAFDDVLTRASASEGALVPTANANLNDDLNYKSVVYALDTAKGNVSKASDLLECRPKTLRSYIARHKELQDIIADYQERVLDLAQEIIFKEVECGDYASARYVLDTLGKDRGFSHKEEFPAKKPDLLISKNMTFEELEQLQTIVLERIADKISERKRLQAPSSPSGSPDPTPES